jgi:hypothetical protein
MRRGWEVLILVGVLLVGALVVIQIGLEKVDKGVGLSLNSRPTSACQKLCNVAYHPDFFDCKHFSKIYCLLKEELGEEAWQVDFYCVGADSGHAANIISWDDYWCIVEPQRNEIVTCWPKNGEAVPSWEVIPESNQQIMKDYEGWEEFLGDCNGEIIPGELLNCDELFNEPTPYYQNSLQCTEYMCAVLNEAGVDCPSEDCGTAVGSSCDGSDDFGSCDDNGDWKLMVCCGGEWKADSYDGCQECSGVPSECEEGDNSEVCVDEGGNIKELHCCANSDGSHSRSDQCENPCDWEGESCGDGGDYQACSGSESGEAIMCCEDNEGESEWRTPEDCLGFLCLRLSEDILKANNGGGGDPGDPPGGPDLAQMCNHCDTLRDLAGDHLENDMCAVAWGSACEECKASCEGHEDNECPISDRPEK